MTEATPTATHADELYAIVAARPDAEAREQADAMMTAATALLIDRDGVDSAIAALGRLAERVRAVKPAPVTDTPQPVDPVEQALGHLRALPVEVATAQARAAIVASNTFLREVGAAPAIMGPLVSDGSAPLLPDHLACAIVDQLKTAPRWDAHERARAVVAGAGAYLHEVFGRSYAAAVIGGALDAAAAYGTEMRGGRDSLDTLH